MASIGDGRDVLTRLHRAHILQDVFGGGRAINASLARFKEAGRGVLIYLRDGTSGVPVAKLPDGERSSSEAERTRQWREIGARRPDPARSRRVVDPALVVP